MITRQKILALRLGEVEDEGKAKASSPGKKFSNHRSGRTGNGSRAPGTFQKFTEDIEVQLVDKLKRSPAYVFHVMQRSVMEDSLIRLPEINVTVQTLGLGVRVDNSIAAPDLGDLRYLVNGSPILAAVSTPNSINRLFGLRITMNRVASLTSGRFARPVWKCCF
ncbi:hypothetical protein ACS0TY_007490 [Phlomoides rotata]